MVNKLTLPAKANDVQSKVNELVDDKQDTLVSGINIKTINNTSIMGSGNITISTGGTYTEGDGIDITNGVISVDNTVALKTDLPTVNNATLTIQKNGTDVQTFTANASNNVTANITVPTTAADVGAVPTTRTVNNKALSSNISLTASDVGALPSSTVIPTVNDATLTITQGGTTKGTFTANASSNTTIALDAGAEADNSTISLNASNKLQTIGVINQRSNDALKIWQGTEAQWNTGGVIPWYNWRTNVNVSSFSGDLLNTATWNSVAYGDGNFVAVAGGTNSTRAVYSTDNGATWTSSILPAGNWQSVAYGDGTFVAVAKTGKKAAYSTDGGATWTEANLGYTGNWYSVAYGDGKFVVVGDSYYFSYSTDGGKTWTHVYASAMGGDSRAVAYGDGKFVAVFNNSNKVAYSSNGTSWTAVSTMPSSTQWQSVTYGNGTFVAVAKTGKKAAYSTDGGATWTASTMPANGSWGSVAYGDGKFVAVSKTKSCAFSVDNGVTWAEATIPTYPINYYDDVTYGSNIFVLTGSDHKTSISFNINFSQCYTDTATPTTSSTVYSAPDTASALTVSSVTSGAITLSDNNTYYYNSSGTAYTYQSVGVAYPDWLCFINGVGVKIGTTVIATYNGE